MVIKKPTEPEAGRLMPVFPLSLSTKDALNYGSPAGEAISGNHLI